MRGRRALQEHQPRIGELFVAFENERQRGEAAVLQDEQDAGVR